MAAKVFLPDRVRVADRVGKNVLIRGCMPLAGDPWTFAYEEIESASGVLLGGRGLSVVSLIDCVGERPMLEAEMSALGLEAPHQSYWPPYERASYAPSVAEAGTLTTEGGPVNVDFYWWPIEGLPEEADPSVFLGKPGWNLSGLIELLTALMADQSGDPRAIYLHCTLGADRTGAAHTCYLFRKSLPMDAAIRRADSMTSAGAPAPDYCRLRAAYASRR